VNDDGATFLVPWIYMCVTYRVCSGVAIIYIKDYNINVTPQILHINNIIEAQK